MKHTIQMIVYSGKVLMPFRKEWELPPVSAEDFDATKHLGKVFMYPDGDITDNMVYMWKICVPETKEEEQKLIELGKWGTLPGNKDYSVVNLAYQPSAK